MSEETKATETQEASPDPIDGYVDSGNESSDPAFGMSMEWAVQVVEWFEAQHQAIQKGLGPNNSLVVGLAGILILSWLTYLLVIQPIPDIRFDVKTFHKVQKPTKVSATMERAYWALSSKRFASHSLSRQSIAKLPKREKKQFNKLMDVLDQSRPELSKKIRASLNMGQATRHLRKNLQKGKPRARSYSSYYVRNVFRPRALHLDMAILLTRSLLLGFFMIFSIRLFFDENTTSEE